MTDTNHVHKFEPQLTGEDEAFEACECGETRLESYLIDSVNVGDVFYDSWGYNMTIVDFYKVVRKTSKKVEVVGLGQEEKHTGFLCGTTTPTDQTTSPHGLLAVRGVDQRDMGKEPYVYLKGTVKDLYGKGDHEKRSVHLTRWSGKPVHFNHCD